MIFSPIILYSFSMVFSGLFLSLGAMAAGGFTWLFATKATRNMGPLKSMFLFQLIGVPLFLFLLPFAPQGIHINSLTISLIGFFETFVLLLLFYALQIGEASVVVPVVNFYALVAAILGIVFLHESVYLFKIIGMVAILIGVVLIGLRLQDLRKKSAKLYKGIVPAFFMAIGSGVYFYFVTISARESGWFATALGIRVVISIMCFILLLIRGEKLGSMFKGITWKFLLPAAAFDVVSFSLYNIAVSTSEVSYVSVIYSTQVVITVGLAYIFLKERLNKLQLLGLGIVVAGLIFLQLR